MRKLGNAMVARTFQSTIIWFSAAVLLVGLVSAISAQAKPSNLLSEIQMLLNELGFPAGSPDGLMGRRTRQAIRAYQREHDLRVTGRPAAVLLGHLRQTRDEQTAQNSSDDANSTDAASAGVGEPTRRRAIAAARALRSGRLRAAPTRRAVALTPFNLGEQLDILDRSGAWLEMRKGEDSGWARLSHVRLAVAESNAASTTKGASSGSSAVGSWATGRRTNRTASTIGIRGVTRNDLQADGPQDYAAMATLDRYATEQDSKRFALDRGLQSRHVAAPAAVQ
jgi:peptidoglycan hydrolase-like protein with peptidoglycan-binding domain